LIGLRNFFGKISRINRFFWIGFFRNLNAQTNLKLSNPKPLNYKQLKCNNVTKTKKNLKSAIIAAFRFFYIKNRQNDSFFCGKMKMVDSISYKLPVFQATFVHCLLFNNRVSLQNYAAVSSNISTSVFLLSFSAIIASNASFDTISVTVVTLFATYKSTRVVNIS
jgi:hypothetical protein